RSQFSRGDDDDPHKTLIRHAFRLHSLSLHRRFPAPFSRVCPSRHGHSSFRLSRRWTGCNKSGQSQRSLDIPGSSQARQGFEFRFRFGFDSSVWTPMSVNGTISWQPAPAWGWSSSAFKIGNVTNSLTISHSTCYDQHHLPHTQTTWTYAVW